jgi:high-affinity K+ transport system ATPase subunit B
VRTAENILARRGVLIKGGAFLEAIGKLKALAVDETGTITEGRPRVTQIVSVDSTDETEIMHPVASCRFAGLKMQKSPKGISTLYRWAPRFRSRVSNSRNLIRARRMEGPRS